MTKHPYLSTKNDNPRTPHITNVPMAQLAIAAIDLFGAATMKPMFDDYATQESMDNFAEAIKQGGRMLKMKLQEQESENETGN